MRKYGKTVAGFDQCRGESHCGGRVEIGNIGLDMPDLAKR
jgi:hypothetical protein